MNWENLTSPEFQRAVKTAKNLCILPLGVLEKHSDHLPIGTDMLIINSVAALAAEKEPAVVFPSYYCTQILEARHWPGAIAIGRDLLMNLLENVCDEIARNGFTKILLLNGHGGNNSFLPFFLMSMLEKNKPYVLYLTGYGFAEQYPEIRKIIETDGNIHAGEVETSLMMALFPDLVKNKNIPNNPALPLRRKKLPPGVSTSIDWYADFPDHYAGDARLSSPEKGKQILAVCVEYTVSVIKAIKEDKTVPELMRKFYNKVFH
ncbi:MAG: creatininase family protein [Spirochaetales bacterium]|nr:creatininase family protein [Spirochaetales bacterium]